MLACLAVVHTNLSIMCFLWGKVQALRFMGGHPLLLQQPEASLLPLGTPGHEALEGQALKVFFLGPGPIGLVSWPPFIPPGQQVGLFDKGIPLRATFG